MEAVTSFHGEEFGFLSNFYPVEILYEGIAYPSSEHAYVAAKTDDISIKNEIALLSSAGKVKRFGRTFELTTHWDIIRLKVMSDILEIKFTNQELRDKLGATGSRQLIEGNHWGDTFWGQCPIGTGKNNLGKLLMEIRGDNDIRKFFG